ncbi:flagellar biosynthesis protein FlgB [Thermocrinis ruber]|uniref:Flagellar basal body rod protein FlgB n=1 Tax=Thermocrinis ruber TaxID=75906 RepID=W0DBJ3_9AQUI|nr:flagellar basal body rod protein FlgB [Thermocrinis ruber]AHE95879.1 flagellar biosynthesis protein FlgB [Thermocrinis ruber]
MDIFKGIDKVLPHLNFAWKRHKVILSNIANADTPNYRAKDVVMEEESVGKLKITREKHISPKSGEVFRVIEIQRRLVGNDFNNVSLEEEMAKLTQNRIAYEAYMRMIRGSVDKLNNIIKEGRQ